MSELAKRKCVPCEGGVPPLGPDEYAPLYQQLQNGWKVVDESQLRREYGFPDFATALHFTNKIGKLAEDEGHHPDILLAWGRVVVTLWTHKAGGLTESDFIMAAKIDELRQHAHS